MIEDYPAVHRPLPDCLVLGWAAAGAPVHAVVAVDKASNRVVIVTAYRPDPMRWSDGFTRRR
ncbi:MAG: DUF4258 domain-containing protein [Deltaproteobacteria bacterium]|nr:DUF4258 domain-containing protein [Deltaproteobacteria bacterium]